MQTESAEVFKAPIPQRAVQQHNNSYVKLGQFDHCNHRHIINIIHQPVLPFSCLSSSKGAGLAVRRYEVACTVDTNQHVQIRNLPAFRISLALLALLQPPAKQRKDCTFYFYSINSEAMHVTELRQCINGASAGN